LRRAKETAPPGSLRQTPRSIIPLCRRSWISRWFERRTATGKSTALVRRIAANSKIPVIASGGICDAESALEKFNAGAHLLQLYTGFVYRGPSLLREIMDKL